MATNSANLAASTVLIPEGLLRSVNGAIHNYSRRDVEEDERETHTLSHIIERPAQAVLATQRLFERSRTPEFGTTGRPQIGLGRPLSYERLSGEREREVRAASINVATLLRRRLQSGRPDSPTLLIEPLSPRHAGSAPRVTGATHHPAVVSDEKLPRIESPSNRVSPIDRPRGTWSPTHRLGRISMHSPDQVPLHLRQDSFVPGRDSITVRRPTYTSERPRFSLIHRADTGDSKKLSKETPRTRQTSTFNTFENAKLRQKALQRSPAFQTFFQYATYFLILASIYFVLAGRPLWGGSVWYIYLLFEYHLTFVGGSAIFVGLAFFYAFGPLLISLEDPAPPVALPEITDEKSHFPPAPYIRCFEDAKPPPPPEKATPNASVTTALLIPCYKSAGLLPATLEAALKIFPATSIYILANGNSPTPLDNTEEVCTTYGVNHIWIPVGSKIVAQYVGSHVIRHLFPHVLLIDDDCLLPPNFPIVTDRLRGAVKCLGYTLTSIGANRSRGTWCQQAQDLEYKLSGLQRAFAGKIGSATFPHGAIVLWDTEFLIKTFKHHPGFSVSEDWFFGHVARILGSRITMCSSVFVETETPSSVFFAPRGGARGGFGEMTVFQQRFKRWNFFFVNGCYYNLAYIFFSWRLGFWEIGTKLFVFQEVYETFLYLITPFVLPISFLVRPGYTLYLFAGTLALYFLNSLIFNEVHLRRAGQMVSRRLLIFYYMPFKLVLTFVNVASCWWSLWQYAKYFAKKHPRIVEDVNAVAVVLKIEEDSWSEKGSSILNRRNERDSPDIEHARGSLRRDGGLGSKRSGRSTRESDAGGGMNRMDSQRSTLSRRGTERSLRPRRLTATALKVDVRPESVVAGRYSPHGHYYEEADPETPRGTPTPPALATENMPLRLGRASSLSGGVFGHLSSWAPSWTGAGEGAGERIITIRGADVMEPVDEAESEHEDGDEHGQGGYSYYGV